MPTLKDIAKVLVSRHQLDSHDAEDFVRAFVDTILEGLQNDRLVKIKGFGTFKLTAVKDRESINVNTGERILISGHDKISFTPDAVMRDLVNKPFAQFETVVLADDVNFEDTKADEDMQETSDSASANGDVSAEKNVEPVIDAENNSVKEQTSVGETPAAPTSKNAGLDRISSLLDDAVIENSTPVDSAASLDELITAESVMAGNIPESAPTNVISFAADNDDEAVSNVIGTNAVSGTDEELDGDDAKSRRATSYRVPYTPSSDESSLLADTAIPLVSDTPIMEDTILFEQPAYIQVPKAERVTREHVVEQKADAEPVIKDFQEEQDVAEKQIGSDFTVDEPVAVSSAIEEQPVELPSENKQSSIDETNIEEQPSVDEITIDQLSSVEEQVIDEQAIDEQAIDEQPSVDESASEEPSIEEPAAYKPETEVLPMGEHSAATPSSPTDDNAAMVSEPSGQVLEESDADKVEKQEEDVIEEAVPAALAANIVSDQTLAVESAGMQAAEAVTEEHQSEDDAKEMESGDQEQVVDKTPYFLRHDSDDEDDDDDDDDESGDTDETEDDDFEEKPSFWSRISSFFHKDVELDEYEEYTEEPEVESPAEADKSSAEADAEVSQEQSTVSEEPAGETLEAEDSSEDVIPDYEAAKDAVESVEDNTVDAAAVAEETTETQEEEEAECVSSEAVQEPLKEFNDREVVQIPLSSNEPSPLVLQENPSETDSSVEEESTDVIAEAESSAEDTETESLEPASDQESEDENSEPVQSEPCSLESELVETEVPDSESVITVDEENTASEQYSADADEPTETISPLMDAVSETEDLNQQESSDEEGSTPEEQFAGNVSTETSEINDSIEAPEDEGSESASKVSFASAQSEEEEGSEQSDKPEDSEELDDSEQSEETNASEEEETNASEEEETIDQDSDEASIRQIFWFYAAVICILIGAITFAAGYLCSDNDWLGIKPAIEKVGIASDNDKEKESEKQKDSAPASVSKAEPKVSKGDPEAESKAAAAKALADQKQNDVKQNADKSDNAVKETAADGDWNKDPRVRHGAYRIIGTKKVITVAKGQTLSRICKIYYGSGMECYIEAYNGGIKEVHEGQKLKLPEIELKKIKKKKE